MKEIDVSTQLTVLSMHVWRREAGINLLHDWSAVGRKTLKERMKAADAVFQELLQEVAQVACDVRLALACRVI